MAKKDNKKQSKKQAKGQSRLRDEMSSMTLDEKRSMLMEKTEDLFRYRMQFKTGQLGQTHLLAQTRKEIARIKTYINMDLVSKEDGKAK